MKFVGKILAACLFVATLAFSGVAMAGVKAVVDKSQQQIYVYRDDTLLYVWDVSTGMPGHGTPSGTFGVQSMDPNHHSSIYDGAWMPWAVFFNGNIAVHGTYKSNYQYLGGVASHGCVRLTQEHAKIFFGLVQSVGPGNVTIIVQS